MVWREPPIVLDAAAALPVDVDRSLTINSHFGAMAMALLNELTSTLLPSHELARRLRSLGGVALNHACSFRSITPDFNQSAVDTANSSEGLRVDEVDDRIRYDAFFGIRRIASIDADTLARSTLVSIGESLIDLADTQLGLHELIAILRGAVMITGWLDVDSIEMNSSDTTPAAAEPALRRFRLGHLVFALMCNFGYHYLKRAGTRLDDIEATAADLDSAAVCIRASTASMWYAGSVPRRAYLLEIRPLMEKASTNYHGFSGLDNFDFRRMRESWENLVAPLSKVIDYKDGGDLRTSAHMLYEIIVQDIEHHILVAAQLVGVAPSLKQERMKGALPYQNLPAVMSLRDYAHDRREYLEQIAGV
jgi:hypothetical protein